MTARSLSYMDAVKLLGGADPRLIAVTNRLTGGLLSVTTGGTSALLLSLFDAEGELAELSGQLIRGLGGRMRGLSRFDRTERLIAAQRVIALTAYFEAVHEVSLPFPLKDLKLSRGSQVAIATGHDVPSERLHAVASILNDGEIPDDLSPLNPENRYEGLRGFYASVGSRLVSYLKELPAWSTLGAEAHENVGRLLASSVPTAAERRYEEHLRRLAAEFPEVAFWIDRRDHAATRAQVRELEAGMGGLGRILDEIASGRLPDQRREGLAERYRRALQRPIATSGDIPDGLVIPALGVGYVSPAFRAAWAPKSSRLDQEAWWEDHPVDDDLQGFMVRYLTSVRATTSPLVILGQPGSGKSVLTKILAARLPARDFLAVRVELREVPADADLQSQVEHAVREATGEALSWPALARTADDALPVIILDGFDELIQATGIGQTDYLEQIIRFQEREADQGRPVAVILTSRTAVADRARLPLGGVAAIRLEPFSKAQVRSWLALWGDLNAEHLQSRGLHPLPAATAMRQPDLASQPLLLLLLALYDADGNALQREDASLEEADLYEGIFSRFAEREVLKDRHGLAGGPLLAAVEEELLRLSVAAFAMFNRGRQWVTEEELSADLEALLGSSPTVSPPARGFHAPPTAAQLAVGRFFFIHQAHAVRNDRLLTACEFLHATFGEFLVARLIARELAALAAMAGLTAGRGRKTADDSFLRVLLSFAPLTTRGKILDFLAILLRRFPKKDATLTRDALLNAFHDSLETRDWGHHGYGPHLTAPIRYAAYSANLLLLMVLADGPVTGHSLFPGASFPAAEWRRHSMLWRSQFAGERWASLASALSLERLWEGEEREIRVSSGPWDPPYPDAYWIHVFPPQDERRKWIGWGNYDLESIRRESYFSCDGPEDIIWHGIAPLVEELDRNDPSPDLAPAGATTSFATGIGGEAVSVTHALLQLWLASSQPTEPGDLGQVYENCLQVIHWSRHPSAEASRSSFFARVLRQLAADHERLDRQTLTAIRAYFERTILTEQYLALHPAVRGWAKTAFADAG